MVEQQNQWSNRSTRTQRMSTERQREINSGTTLIWHQYLFILIHFFFLRLGKLRGKDGKTWVISRKRSMLNSMTNLLRSMKINLSSFMAVPRKMSQQLMRSTRYHQSPNTPWMHILNTLRDTERNTWRSMALILKRPPQHYLNNIITSLISRKSRMNWKPEGRQRSTKRKLRSGRSNYYF